MLLIKDNSGKITNFIELLKLGADYELQHSLDLQDSYCLKKLLHYSMKKAPNNLSQYQALLSKQSKAFIQRQLAETDNKTLIYHHVLEFLISRPNKEIDRETKYKRLSNTPHSSIMKVLFLFKKTSIPSKNDDLPTPFSPLSYKNDFTHAVLALCEKDTSTKKAIRTLLSTHLRTRTQQRDDSARNNWNQIAKSAFQRLSQQTSKVLLAHKRQDTSRKTQYGDASPLRGALIFNLDRGGMKKNYFGIREANKENYRKQEGKSAPPRLRAWYS